MGADHSREEQQRREEWACFDAHPGGMHGHRYVERRAGPMDERIYDDQRLTKVRHDVHLSTIVERLNCRAGRPIELNSVRYLVLDGPAKDRVCIATSFHKYNSYHQLRIQGKMRDGRSWNETLDILRNNRGEFVVAAPSSDDGDEHLEASVARTRCRHSEANLREPRHGHSVISFGGTLLVTSQTESPQRRPT